jgi:hypothetical protein
MKSSAAQTQARKALSEKQSLKKVLRGEAEAFDLKYPRYVGWRESRCQCWECARDRKNAQAAWDRWLVSRLQETGSK